MEENLNRENEKGILVWYDFPADSRIIYDGSRDDAVFEMLCEKGLNPDCLEVSRNQHSYDYVISIAVPEREREPLSVIKNYKNYLKPGGKLLIAMNNRMGIRYFCGDHDPYTKRNFDGIEGYRNAYSKEEDTFFGKAYDMAELREMISEAGFKHACFFSVISDLSRPTILFREDYLPKEDLATRVTPRYEYPDTVFLQEESLYSGLAKNGLFHAMANAYLIECFDEGDKKAALQVTVSMSRGRENALTTVITDNGIVEKKAVYSEGVKRLSEIKHNVSELKERGISVVDMELAGDILTMPCEDAPVGQMYLRELMSKDVDAFLKAMDHFRDLILQSSDHEREDEKDGVILSKAYIDMVPLNTFYKDGEFVFFDQEFMVEHYPANAIISRLVHTFYDRNRELNTIYPMENVLKRYGLFERQYEWYKMDIDFFKDILERDGLEDDRRNHRAYSDVIASNRLRVNMPADRYQKVFVDIFNGADEKKIAVFGSGNFAKRFLELFGKDYTVDAIIDNRKEKAGEELFGIKIVGPEYFDTFDRDNTIIIICIKDFVSVVNQLESLGIKDYRIYDAGRDYPRKRVALAPVNGDSTEKKKYHVGYVAGVFDLFHVGHLNMFKRAKELCDYLIVGMVCDETVRKNKKVEPFVPFEERKAMVASCRYVDEIFEIPETLSSVRESYRLLHYDVQFSGSDYENDPVWLEEQAYLRKRGSDLVFFPYTESTSSSKLKELISKKLL